VSSNAASGSAARCARSLPHGRERFAAPILHVMRELAAGTDNLLARLTPHPKRPRSRSAARAANGVFVLRR